MLEILPVLVDQTKNVGLVRLKGILDAATAPILKKFLTDLIAGGTGSFVLNLSQVGYVSSSGWSVILGKLLELRDRGGDVFLLEMQPAVLTVFKLMGLDTSVRHYDSLPVLVKEMDLSFVEVPGAAGANSGPKK